MKKEPQSYPKNKIQATMRSLYRFSELRNLSSPEILIDNERQILRQYLSSLNAEEMLYISQNFNAFYESYKTQSAIEDERLTTDFQQYLHNLN